MHGHLHCINCHLYLLLGKSSLVTFEPFEVGELHLQLEFAAKSHFFHPPLPSNSSKFTIIRKMPLSLYSNQFLVTSQQTGPPYLFKIFPKNGPKGPLSRPALSEDLLILRTTYSPHNTRVVRLRRRSALN